MLWFAGPVADRLFGEDGDTSVGRNVLKKYVFAVRKIFHMGWATQKRRLAFDSYGVLGPFHLLGTEEILLFLLSQTLCFVCLLVLK